MKKFLLVDASNLYFRIKHICQGDAETKASLGLHIVLNSMKTIHKRFNIDHVVWCLEGSSWRKEIDPTYKLTRQNTLAMRTQKERDEDNIYFGIMHSLNDFLREKTNVSVLQSVGLEADDFVAGWIDRHPNDEHLILSGDSDFYQLLAPNVSIYDGVDEEHVTIEGVYGKDGNQKLDKKTKEPMRIDPEYALFKKIVRGDASDNILSAYPGVREKGSVKKPGIREAFNDRNSKGYDWNSFMLTEYYDDDGKKVKVIDKFNVNKFLIDLRSQPEEIKVLMNQVIEDVINKPIVSQVGFNLIQFAGTYSLEQIKKTPTPISQVLASPYKKV